ncbi:MAG: relaxase [Zetaproteobacteria bacterium]|nr:MAG: relaxase [Zetaproteobacteria bacterium]
MILKGNQRAGGRQMALHLMNGEQNEHVTLHEVSGFIASDILGALNEAYALSQATQCRQFMYSLSLNPPQDEEVSISSFEDAINRAEKKLGLENQPRVIVFHEKEGRRHAHCVWSRIDIENMKAINIAFPKRKLQTIAKSLYLEHGWKMPEGFKDKSKKNPLNFTRDEWQQAARVGRKPHNIKRELQESWAVSDNKQGFENALRESGYYLARGDRRGYVAVDIHGEVYSLSRQLGVKTKELNTRLGKTETLPSVCETKNKISNQLSGLFTRYSDELKTQHKKDMKPLLHKKQEMTTDHRIDRAQLNTIQQEHWHSAELKRAARIRKGFKGLWDKLNGRYWKTRKQNERETWQAHKRDQKQREELIHKQLNERQNLQVQINLLRQNQDTERKDLIRDLSHVKSNEKQKTRVSERAKSHKKDHQNDIGFGDLDLGNDYEPEI